MLWEEFVIFRGNVSFVGKNIDIHNQKHVYPKLNGFRDNGEINLKNENCYTFIDYQIRI